MSTLAGVWAEWGEWSECDPSSSNCKKFRARQCANAPSTSYCDGDPTETAPCPSDSPNQPPCQYATNPGDFWANVFLMDKLLSLRSPKFDDLCTVMRQLSISSWLVCQEILNFLSLPLFYRCCWYLGRVGGMVGERPHLVQWQEVQIPQLQQCSFSRCL